MSASSSVVEVSQSAPVARPSSPFHRAIGFFIHPLMIVLYLTIIGGALRFIRLDQPPAWVDEAMTYSRTSGDIPELLKSLENQAFPPLHYLTLWQIRQWHPLTVATMRFYPAVCGTLMIPAMYFLTRQMLSRKHALLAALFTACSAWLITHSRDAKMYMPLWLFVTLNAGCFLWWIRSRTWTGWLCWIATGCAAVGLHGLGFIILGLQPIWLLTSRRVKWTQGVWFVIGMLIISAGPIGYYASKIRPREHQIEWVDRRNAGHDGLELTGDTLSALLFKYSWIQEWDEGIIPHEISRGATWVFMALGTCCVLGLFPWKRSNVPIRVRVRDTLRLIPHERFRQMLAPRASVVFVRPVRQIEAPREPWWRTAVWMLTWLVLPLYGVYLASTVQAMSPLKVWSIVLHTLAGEPTPAGAPAVRWDMHVLVLWFVAITAVVAALLMTHAWVRRAVALVALGLPAALWLYAMRVKLGFVDPERATLYWITLLLHQKTIWIVGTLGMALAWHYSAATLTGRCARAAQLLLVIVILFGIMTGMAKAMNDPGDSVWMPRYLGVIWPGLCIAVVVLLSRLPTWPLRWLAFSVLIGVNLAQTWSRVCLPSDPPIDRIVQDVIDEKKPQSHQLTFVTDSPIRQGGPGMGRIEGIVGRMYLFQLSGNPATAHSDVMQGRRNDIEVRLSTHANLISRMLVSRPDVTRVVTWDAYRLNSPARTPTPPGPEWALTDTDAYRVRVHWSHGMLYDYVRREYVKSPSTQPATAPK